LCDACVAFIRAGKRKRIEAGLCPICGDRSGTPNRQLCARCHASQQRRYATRREERAARGLCIACGLREKIDHRNPAGRCRECADAINAVYKTRKASK